MTLATQQAGRPRSRTYEVVHRVARRGEAAVVAAYVSSVIRAQGLVDDSALRAAIRTGDMRFIEQAGGAELLAAVLAQDDALRAAFLRTTILAGTVTGEMVQGAATLPFSFTAMRPDVVLFARTMTADLVVQVTKNQRDAIRLAAALGKEQGIPIAGQARLIRGVVGLRPSHAQAPARLAQEIRDGLAGPATARRLSAVDKQRIRSRIARGTVTEEFIADVRRNYERSLLNRRALDIARTESLRAAHHGQRQAWRQATEAGVLPRTARRHWIVTPDDRLRDTHAEIPGLNPDGVRLGEPFQTPLGPSMGPPLEPLCRCGTGLLFPGRKGVL